MKNKIVPCLWFNGNGLEAAEFYTSVFDHAGLGRVVHNTPSSGNEGSVLAVEFFVEDFSFLALNAGVQFSPNPSISFFVHCADEREVNQLWEKLSVGGRALMPLNEYPFSKRYGWIEDRFGVSWQLHLPQQQVSQKIVPCLLFTRHQFGRAADAMEFYTSVFKESSVEFISRYGEPHPYPQAINYGALTLEGQHFVVMENHESSDFHFSEGVSLIIHCHDQQEVDYFWERLSGDGGEEGNCGWLKDRYGVSWQVVPEVWMEWISQEDRAKADQYMRAMITMKKMDVAALKAAAE